MTPTLQRNLGEAARHLLRAKESLDLGNEIEGADHLSFVVDFCCDALAEVICATGVVPESIGMALLRTVEEGREGGGA